MRSRVVVNPPTLRVPIVAIPVTYKSVISTLPTNLDAVTTPVKYPLVAVRIPSVLIPVTKRFRVVVVPVTPRVAIVATPVTFNLSIWVWPVNLEVPNTSNKTVGFVLPIPTLWLTSSYTKFGAPSTNPAELWNWTSWYAPPAPDLIVFWFIHVNPPKLFLTKISSGFPGWFK